MAVLADTNITLRLAQPHHPQAASALRALRSLRSAGESIHIAHQNLVEYWVVSTRPIEANGLGYSAERAAAEIETLKRLFDLVPEEPLHSTWERLVVEYNVSGKNAHDARLVAAMIVNGIDSILTFNSKDFARYREVRVLDAHSFA
jgi:predicted nucleic acid-binding protein